ncbi:MAG: Xaa-Pro peptidase family protein [Tissierellales bacterium]|jgi:Xaa-Pro dipeptidase|nr:Xaa-Pro peptidase family protein [Tissierellales bacterium]
MNQKRLNVILGKMQEKGLDQVVITSPESIFYLLDEWIHPGERMLALYLNKQGETKLFLNELFPISKDLGVEIQHYNDTEDPIEYLTKIVSGNTALGIDKEWPSHFLIRLMKKMPELKVEIGSESVDEARMIKDEDERELLRKASQINDKVMAEAIELVKAGHSEVEVGKRLADVYAKYDTPAFSFDPLICYGENAAEPHHSSDETKWNENECVIIDIGGLTNSYASDMTRSIFLGEPNEEYKKIYNLVKEANAAGIAAVKPGAKFSDIDKAARKVIEDGGYGPYFTHRTGHNVGICVHEAPDVSMTNDMEVKEGMVFSVEPGIYLTGKYGVRIEDLVLVTKDGCEVLNSYPKDLQIVK